MTTLVSLIGIVGRAIGGVLTSSLGWASSLLYGRIPADHRKYVDIIMGSSLAWGVLVLITLLPGVVGLAGCFVPADENRPKGIAILGTILRGYPLTILVILLAMFLPAVGVARKIGNA